MSTEFTVDQESAPRGVSRRSVVKAAAWSVPVIAVAVSTPAAAASVAASTLTFELPSYDGTSCGTLTGIRATLTTDGTAPDAGKAVTISLAGGYTFANGSTSWIGTTAPDGTVTLPDVKIPANAASGSVTAVAGTLTATASLTATAGGTAFFRGPDGAAKEYPTVPVGSTAVGRNAFLAPDGDLYVEGVVIASGVSAAYADVNSANQTIVGFVAGGVASYYGPNGATSTFTSVPANATPLGRDAYLAPNGSLWVQNTLVAAGVSSAVARPNSANQTVIGFVQNGVASFYGPTGTVSTYSSVPAGSTAVGRNVFLAPNGDLYEGDTLIASNVSKAFADLNSANQTCIGYVSAGVAYYRGPTGTTLALTSVPVNSTPVGRNVFLAPNGDLYESNTQIASGVSSSAARFNSANVPVIGYVASTGC